MVTAQIHGIGGKSQLADTFSAFYRQYKLFLAFSIARGAIIQAAICVFFALFNQIATNHFGLDMSIKDDIRGLRGSKNGSCQAEIP